MIPKTLLIWFLALGPLYTMAQKAYETSTYSGKINGQVVIFKLANGYIVASEIGLNNIPKKSPVIYRPESGVTDTADRLIFKSDKPSAGYFIIKNMHEAYDQVPAVINGVFIKNDRRSQIRLLLVANKI